MVVIGDAASGFTCTSQCSFSEEPLLLPVLPIRLTSSAMSDVVGPNVLRRACLKQCFAIRMSYVIAGATYIHSSEAVINGSAWFIHNSGNTGGEKEYWSCVI